MSTAIDVGQRFRQGLRVVGLAVASDRRTSTQSDATCPSITSGGGAPNHVAEDGSLYMRTDGAAGSTHYQMIAGVWTAIAATAVSGTDFGAGGLATDVIAESTAAAGVTIDGVLLKDERWQATAAGVATGDAGITLKDNLASAFDVKESTNSYLTFVTTDSAESVAVGKRLTTTDGVASGTARIVGGTAAVDTVASTAITGATETLSAFDHCSYALPANSLKVGTVVKIRAQGIYTATTGTENHIFAVRVASASIAVTGNIDPADNDVWSIEFTFTCRATGASGTIVGFGTCVSGARATAAPVVHRLSTGSTSTSTATVDTTAALTLAIALDRQGTATDSDSMRADWFHVEILG